MSKSPQVEMHVIVNKDDTQKYSGRFLGFIKDDEFNAICHSKELASKIECGETQSLMGSIANRSNLSGHRLVLVVKKVNDVVIKGKRLFISEKLDYISGEDEKERKVTFTGPDKSTIVMQEKE